MANEWSVELSYEEIRRIATEHFKFEIIVRYYHACTVPKHSVSQCPLVLFRCLHIKMIVCFGQLQL